MRFVHIADTHIGYAAYNASDPETGRNQREVDIEQAFRQAVDKILDIRPEFVLHSGDLFHTVRPSNRALAFAMEQISRITDAGIPFMVIAGNHSAPRLRETGSVFRIISRIKGVHAFYRERYERMELGDMLIHALPHVHGGERFLAELSKMEPQRSYQYNIAMIHSGVEGLKAFRYSTNEANEDLMDINQLREGFDYVAFGHYHEFKRLKERAYYSGSTERLTFSDVGQKKGFIEVITEPFTVKFHELKIRPMIELEPIDARGKSASRIISEMEERMGDEMEGAIVRLVIRNIADSEYRSIDSRRIKRMGKNALHLEIKFLKTGSDSAEVDVVSLSTIEKDFEEFVKKTPVEGYDKEKLIKIGKKYLAKAVEGEL